MIFQQHLVMILRRIIYIMHSDSIPYGNTTAALWLFNTILYEYCVRICMLYMYNTRGMSTSKSLFCFPIWT